MYRVRKVCCRLSCLFYYTLLALGLSLALLVSFEQVVQASDNLTTLSSPYVHRLWGNDKRLSAILSVWKEVDLVYDRLFPYDRSIQPHTPAGCVVLPAISTRSDRQGTGIKTTPAVLMLRCQERIDLLRPAWWVSNRLREQNQQGFLLLSIPEMGIADVQVQLVTIRSSAFNPTIVAVKSASSRPVIGIFIRHTTNVRQYTFKDTLTGKLERINATPNHPFYVVNQHRYIPVSQLSMHDRMVNVSGHPIVMVCSKGKSSHCGQPYHPGKVITVYNLEVYGQHRYFVGEPGILVHNVYQCKHCGIRFYKENLFNSHVADHDGGIDAAEVKEKPFACETCGKRFRRSGYLAKHLKIHNRPLKCEFCKRSFFNDKDFQKHLNGQTHKYLQKLKAHYTPDMLSAPADTSSAASIEETEQTEQKEERERSRSPLFPPPPPKPQIWRPIEFQK